MTGKPSRALLDEIDRILADCMGARPLFRQRARTWTAWTWVILWLVCYGMIWAGIALFALPPGISEPKLVSLLAWGGLYFAVAIYIAHAATTRIRKTVEDEVLPAATDDYGKAVAADLGKRFPRGWLFIPVPIALAAVEAAWWAAARDIGRPWHFFGWWSYSWESWLWGLSYLLYFFTAGVVVIAARFYTSFAAKFEAENTDLYVLGASETPLVKALSKLDRQVLVFWMLILALILTSAGLSFLPGGYRLGWDSWLLSLLVPTTGFFSFVFGGLVFALAEARIRATLRRFTNDQARLLLQECNAIVCSSRELTPGDKDRVDRLMALRDQILLGGRYGNRVRAGFGMATPLAASVVSLVASFAG